MQEFIILMHTIILFRPDTTRLMERTTQMPQAWHYTTTLTALSDGKTIQNTANKIGCIFFVKKNVKNEPKIFFSAYCNCEYFDRKGGYLQ